MNQGLLFPDGFAILEQALVALRDIEVRRADEFVRRARAAQPGLVNLDVVERACDYLRDHLADNPGVDECAEAFLAVSRDVEAERLGEEVGRFLDLVVARYLARQHSGGPFVDRAARMPWGRVLLLVGRPAAARRGLLELVASSGRADLWGALGDAALRVDRAEEANAAYVRALVLDPHAVDGFRLEHAALRACYVGLRTRHGPVVARELLLPQAWIDGVLEIPPGNRWLAGEPETDPQPSVPEEEGPGVRRIRRFARLLFADRTAGTGNVDIARREEMAGLEPGLFGCYVDACRRREIR